MKEIFLQYKIVILRTVGSLFFIVAFVIFFWTTPKEGVSENEIAARNVARMEAHIVGSVASQAKAKPSHVPLIHAYKETQAKQMRYFLIILMMVGIGFLGYSFVKPKS